MLYAADFVSLMFLIPRWSLWSGWKPHLHVLWDSRITESAKLLCQVLHLGCDLYLNPCPAFTVAQQHKVPLVLCFREKTHKGKILLLKWQAWAQTGRSQQLKGKMFLPACFVAWPSCIIRDRSEESLPSLLKHSQGKKMCPINRDMCLEESRNRSAWNVT